MYLCLWRVFRDKVVAKGPVWESTIIEGELDGDAGGTGAGGEATMEGSLSLLVELDEVRCRYTEMLDNIRD